MHKGIAYKIHRPLFIRACRAHLLDPGMARALRPFPCTQRKPLLPVNSFCPFMVLHQAFAAQQFMQPGRTETPSLFRQFPQASAQKQIAVLGWRPLSGAAVELDDSASPPLGIAVLPQNVLHGFSASCGLQKFFESTSFRMTISRACSPTILFNRAFSSSNCRSRLASETCIPPNLLRHL